MEAEDSSPSKPCTFVKQPTFVHTSWKEQTTAHFTMQYFKQPGTPLLLNNNQFNPTHKIQTDEQKMYQWKGKALHGRYPQQLAQEHIDQKESSFKAGNFFGGLLNKEVASTRIIITQQKLSPLSLSTRNLTETPANLGTSSQTLLEPSLSLMKF